MPDRDVNITAVFGKNSYNVTLNLNGGTINSGNVTTYTYGEGATLPTDVTRSGYTFAGWYASAALTGSPVTAITNNRRRRQRILGEVDRERAARAGSASGNRLHSRRRPARGR